MTKAANEEGAPNPEGENSGGQKPGVGRTTSEVKAARCAPRAYSPPATPAGYGRSRGDPAGPGGAAAGALGVAAGQHRRAQRTGCQSGLVLGGKDGRRAAKVWNRAVKRTVLTGTFRQSSKG